MQTKPEPRGCFLIYYFTFSITFVLILVFLTDYLRPKLNVYDAKPKEKKQTRLQYYENKFLESLSPISNNNSKSLALIKSEEEQKERDKKYYCRKLVNNATHWGSKFSDGVSVDFLRGVYKNSRGIITEVNCYWGAEGPLKFFGKPGRSVGRCNRKLEFTLETRRETDLVYQEGSGSKIIEYSRFSYCNRDESWSKVEQRIIGFGKYQGECLYDRKCYK